MFTDGGWIVNEPIMIVDIIIPNEFQGVVMNSLSRKDAILAGTDIGPEWITLYAEVSKEHLIE